MGIKNFGNFNNYRVARLRGQKGSKYAKSGIDKKQDKRINQLARLITATHHNKLLTPTALVQVSAGFRYDTPYQIGLNQIALGTGYTQRIGPKINNKLLKVNITFRSSTDSGENASVRCLIVCNKQNRGSTTIDLQGSHTADAYGLGLFNNYAVGATNYNNTNFLFNENIEFSKLFKVIYDKKFYLDNSVHGLVKTLTIRKKLNFMTDYGFDNDGDMQDITSNAIYMIIIGDNATTYIDFVYDYFLHFSDT